MIPLPHDAAPIDGQTPEEDVLQEANYIEGQCAGSVKIDPHTNNIIQYRTKFAYIEYNDYGRV